MSPQPSARSKLGVKEAETLPRSHGALGDAFLDKVNLHIRYDWDRGCFYLFDGHHYAGSQDPAVRFAIEQFLPPSMQNRGTVEGIAKSLRDRPELAAPTSWDPDSHLLATPGGTVDLRTGVLSTAKPEHLITQITAVAPDFERKPGNWLRAMKDWLGEDQVEHDYHQILAGYFLTGEMKEHALPLWLGIGGRGKSKISNTYHYIMGTYAGVAADTAFLETRFRAHPEEIAMLRGSRLVLYSEVDGAWNEGRIKAVTGGDPLTAAFKFGRTFTYFPTFKILATSNNEPNLRTVGKAMERRFHVYKFDRPIPFDDKDLGHKLREEAPAILAWMIRGAVRYYAEGLARSPAVEEATKEYLLGTDHIGQWIEDRCELGPDYRMHRMGAYQDLRDYLEANGRRYLPDMETFKAALAERGVIAKKKPIKPGQSPEHALVGIRFKAECAETSAAGKPAY